MLRRREAGAKKSLSLADKVSVSSFSGGSKLSPKGDLLKVMVGLLCEEAKSLASVPWS